MKYLLAMVLLIVSALPAQALPQCGDRDEIIKALARQYQEQGRVIALTGANVAEIFVSEKGTWTFMVTSSLQGKTCIIATGDNWKELPPVKPKGTDL